MATKKEYPVITCSNQEEWAAWLQQHHAAEDGVWIRIHKKHTGVPSIVYAEALDEALCYGWIDGMSKRIDEDTYVQKFTPRRPKSVWSVRNREHIDRLLKAGKMLPPGLQEVERAKADGRWDDAYSNTKTAELPDDFLAVLKKNKKATAFYDTLTKQNKFAIYYRLHTAKKPETRTKRIDTIIAMLEKNEKFYP
ncbi:YdeI/OmpD-associated family protein [Chitinophaga nivalis]|uniref:YdeI/OmpD-associated family protein n=1 Tax=Chitinophaga nivalis TaxID=2991709 RepID=A0ABT3IN73_9BACT|nr:YdeI/OmpD-associated family protein [Chitinophaga nivalis]MCW3464898.1 YdeI/OmpD-associated family protein [Chitinophaga nivalis]MCW3485411.1 YdeI/OmpD-associated family protein [Chitinophaga nivalis]